MSLSITLMINGTQRTVDLDDPRVTFSTCCGSAWT